MNFLPESLQHLIDEFARLPGVGPKSAQRLAMHLLHSPETKVQALASTISTFKTGLKFCQECWNISEGEICKICSNLERNKYQICVVEEILDTMALEKTKQFKGVYHVLHGVLSPVDGIGPEQIKVAQLLQRIEQMPKEEVEVIIATNPSLEGETTAMYIQRLLKPLEVRVTRIARGLPAGGDLDYADEVTLIRALQGRSDY